MPASGFMNALVVASYLNRCQAITVSFVLTELFHARQYRKEQSVIRQRETKTNGKPNTLLKTGIIGSVIAALCCFTPVLVLLLGAIGLSSLVAPLDIVLLPLLGVFVGITIYALMRKYRR